MMKQQLNTEVSKSLIGLRYVLLFVIVIFNLTSH